MNRTVVVATLASLLGAGYASTAFSQAKPDVQVKQRQSVMTLQGKYFGPINLMASGKMPFDASLASRNAGYLEVLAKMPWDNFTPDTQGEKSRALPEVFKDAGKFKEAQDRLMSEATKLAAAAKSGNESNFKAAAADVGKACGGCHDSFRTKQ